MIDKYAIVPMSACVFALIVSPLLVYVRSVPPKTLQSMSEPALENRIFWPAMAAISVVLAVQNRSRLGKLPPPIICLLAYLAFAGASVLRAFEPEVSFIRFASQVMVVLSIILPAMLADRTVDMMPGLFLCILFDPECFFRTGQLPRRHHARCFGEDDLGLWRIFWAC